MKFLPKNIGEKFPELEIFYARRCVLSNVPNFVFKNMQKLERLHLEFNKIVTIESGAFHDLIEVKSLSVEHNLIETIHENLFATMKSLREINFQFNNIAVLSPMTFEIPGGVLGTLRLKGNVCLTKHYNWHNWNMLQPDLIAHCFKRQ